MASIGTFSYVFVSCLRCLKIFIWKMLDLILKSHFKNQKKIFNLQMMIRSVFNMKQKNWTKLVDFDIIFLPLEISK